MRHFADIFSSRDAAGTHNVGGDDICAIENRASDLRDIHTTSCRDKNLEFAANADEMAVLDQLFGS
jgi:hypothetical protein